MAKYAAKRSAVYLLVMAVLLGISAAEDVTPEPEPYRVDFIEETGIDLILLDVEVYDQEGRPICGLKKEDFTLKINSRVRTIYSVDDLCACSDPAPEEQQVADTASPVPEPAADQPPLPDEPMLFVLFLNFGQLQQDGRVHALEEAERWIREDMQPDDQVRILAWSFLAGLKEISPATNNKDKLLQALERADRDPLFNDPFPELRENRKRKVKACFDSCSGHDCIFCVQNATQFAQEEYSRGKWSLQAMQHALYTMEGIPGKKVMLYFYQNDLLFPARIYPGTDGSKIMDHLEELNRTAADAALSRTNIVAAFSGSNPEGGAINFGANIADYTGGDYSRASYLLPTVTSAAGRGRRCVYRVGVAPPPVGNKRILHASVWVQDLRVPRRWRLRHLSRFDRWLREAQAVLLYPESATDVPVTASLHPVGVEKGRWNLMVRVVVDAERLLLLPAVGGKAGVWETGALMYREPGTDAKELLAHSRLTVEEEATGNYVVHERILDGIKPGEWYLGTFVRDRNANAFGGSASAITLPKPGEAGLSIPVPFRTGQPWIRTGLPDMTDKPKKVADETRSREILQEPFPLPGRPIKRGHDLEFRTWVCSPKKGKGDAVVRFIAREGEPIFRFETVKPPKGGSCIELVDPVETRYLEPGEYVYHIRYSPEGRPEPLAEETMFLLE